MGKKNRKKYAKTKTNDEVLCNKNVGLVSVSLIRREEVKVSILFLTELNVSHGTSHVVTGFIAHRRGRNPPLPVMKGDGTEFGKSNRRNSVTESKSIGRCQQQDFFFY
ncbi:hypothetical protein CEXT_398051 [Caerostris extrusa]|uniref:Uncharacterized protein n=1 Tax=Caerostris extrusa TaxID=172846 RepID=A0AAV4NJL5_CAEEX|nr:hypothetical protein CEXT_398051 [Caerostris extrusa]